MVSNSVVGNNCRIGAYGVFGGVGRQGGGGRGMLSVEERGERKTQRYPEAGDRDILRDTKKDRDTHTETIGRHKWRHRDTHAHREIRRDIESHTERERERERYHHIDTDIERDGEHTPSSALCRERAKEQSRREKQEPIAH